MKTSITACLLALTLAGCLTQPPGAERMADNQVPPARIYIAEMTRPGPDLAEVQFSRITTFINGNSPLELAINDVVLAQMLSGEHMSIWLKPGTSYTFSVKPVHSLNSPSYPETRTLTLQLSKAGTYKVRISANVKGLTLQQDN
jgi:hypothetical protein